MTNREFFIQTAGSEMAIFERVFLALPQEKATYSPHERSKNAIDLANTCVMEVSTFPIFLKDGKMDWMSVPKSELKTFAEVAKTFGDHFAASKTLAEQMTDAEWETAEASMTMGGQNEWKSTKGDMAWGLLLDLIHHRGQLSTYIRPMGGKVPSIYGPSGDSQ